MGYEAGELVVPGPEPSETVVGVLVWDTVSGKFVKNKAGNDAPGVGTAGTVAPGKLINPYCVGPDRRSIERGDIQQARPNNRF